VDDAVELRHDGDRAMRGRLRGRRAADAGKEKSREQQPPHAEIV
jgi:hypothetical protein